MDTRLSHMIYGYASNQLNEDGLLELKEVTFVVTPESLKEIASFFIAMANRIENEVNFSHHHIDEYITDWGSRFPNNDIIVSNIRWNIGNVPSVIESVREPDSE